MTLSVTDLVQTESGLRKQEVREGFMQITVTFKSDVIELPIATGATVQGLIYRAINEDPCYSSLVHTRGKQAEGRNFKLFTFGELKGRYKVDGQLIRFYGETELEVRSVDPYFVQLLLAYFTIGKTVRLGNNDAVVCGVNLGGNNVFLDKIVVRTASPITAYITKDDGHTVYFSPYDSEFYGLLHSNAKRKWLSNNGDEKGFSLSVSPLENCKYIKRATRFKDTFITAWHGSFVLNGNPETLSFLYNAGLGSKNSQGFGMFDVLP